MRVMCVANLGIEKSILPIELATCPKILEECTVVGSEESDGLLMYYLAEYPNVRIGNTEYERTWDARAFATLPEQTADEMNEVEKEAIIM